jgi:hypothetical protein
MREHMFDEMEDVFYVVAVGFFIGGHTGATLFLLMSIIFAYQSAKDRREAPVVANEAET